MHRTDDNYNLYFDGELSKHHQETFKNLIDRNKIAGEFVGLLKREYNCALKNSYNEHKILLWILYKSINSFAITIFFAEDDHPYGCEYQAKVDFCLDESGQFEYELKNHLVLHYGQDFSDACKERIEQKTVGFEADCVRQGNIREMDLEAFIASLTVQ